MTPEESAERRRRALTRLDEGAGIRQVAREIGCSPAAVILWRDARGWGVESSKWDRYGTGGRRYHDEDRVGARARRTRRLHPAPTEAEMWFAIKHAVPAWLTPARIRAACIRSGIRLPCQVDGESVESWEMKLDVLLGVHRELRGLESVERIGALQTFDSLSDLIIFQLKQLGFAHRHESSWKSPGESTAMDRFQLALGRGRQWPPLSAR